MPRVSSAGVKSNVNTKWGQLAELAVFMETSNSGEHAANHRPATSLTEDARYT